MEREYILVGTMLEKLPWLLRMSWGCVFVRRANSCKLSFPDWRYVFVGRTSCKFSFPDWGCVFVGRTSCKLSFPDWVVSVRRASSKLSLPDWRYVFVRRTSWKLSFPEWGCVFEKGFLQVFFFFEFPRLEVCLCEKDFLQVEFPRLGVCL